MDRVYISSLNQLELLHLTWHLDAEEIESKSELLTREFAEIQSQIFEILVSFFENLRSMYVEAIETYSKIIAVESECMRLVCVGCHLDLLLHLGKCTDECSVILREIQISDRTID